RALSLVEEISWKDLKNLTESLSKNEIEDSVFDYSLKHLIDARIVKKENERYSLIDPIYKILRS
ncbi:MAG: AAA family ATPase, partial [Nitrososphaeria archaeon]